MNDYNNNNNNHGHNRFNNNRHFDNNRGPRFDHQNGERKFQHTDVTFKDKTDEQIVQILLDKQKKIGRNVFGSDLHPLYELIIRQNKRIKSLEEKNNPTKFESPVETEL